MGVYSAGAILFLLIALFSFIFLTMHFMYAIGINDIAKDKGEEKHWLAWIPVANVILIFMLVEKTDRPIAKNKLVIYFGLLVLFSLITLPVFASLETPLLSNPLMPMIIPMFFTLIVFRVLINDYTKFGTIHTLLGIITFGFSIPFQIYGFRNNMLEMKGEQSTTNKQTTKNKRRKAN